MLGQVTKTQTNVFKGGVNSDVANNFQSSEQYTDANNVTLTANGQFLSLTNLKGTTPLTTVLPDAVGNEVLGVFAVTLTVDSTRVPGLIIVATDYAELKILAYDTTGETLYEMFTQEVAADYDADSRVVDAELYPENNIDYLYFTDRYHERRKLKCEIPADYVANFLSEFDLKVERPLPLGIPTLVDITTGGNLLCGSYQISYQLYNPAKNKYTKFSLLTNPIMVYAEPTDTRLVNGGIGILSPYQIILDISLSELEYENYTHFRLAVIENIYPDIVPTDATMTSFSLIADYEVDGVIKYFPFAKNTAGEKILISELVVETSPINTVNTLAVKDNRLFVGGVTYKDLEYDMGDPIFESGTILKEISTSKASPFMDMVFASSFKGHFRNEVYRYAISYFDGDGNFSTPKVFDCSSVTDNQFTSYITPANVMDNETFDDGLTGWSQVATTGSDGDWVASTYGLDNTVKIEKTLSSKVLYQNIPEGSGPSVSFSINFQDSNLGTPTVVFAIYYYRDGVQLASNTGGTVAVAGAGTVAFSTTMPATCNEVGVRYLESPSNQVGDMHIKSFTCVTSLRYHKDMKFPDRSEAGYSLWSTTTPTRLQSLGLQFTNITKHPTWAKGFVILRQPRQANIVTQTPVVPMVPVYGIGAVQDYPTRCYENTGAVDYEDAQPMGPNTTMVPKNYLWAETRAIVKNTTQSPLSPQTQYRRFTGEAKFEYRTSSDTQMIFPGDQMYRPTQPFGSLSGLNLRVVDAVAARANIQKFDSGAYSSGASVETNLSATIFGIKSGDYFFDAAHDGTKSLGTSSHDIKDYSFFDNYGEGETFVGEDVLKYSNLETTGVVFGGGKANTQRTGVIKLSSSFSQLSRSLTFASSPTFYTPNITPTLPDFVTSSTGNTGSYVEVIPIVNIEKGLGDNRYGKPTDKQEFIFTGTMVVFDEDELEDVALGVDVPKTVDIWGGDCVVGTHLFKLTDTVYTLTNSYKFGMSSDASIIHPDNLRNRWGKVFLSSDNNTVISTPIPYTGCAQYMEVILESEYVGHVRDYDFYKTITTDGTLTMAVYGATSENAGFVRTPLNYNYNANYNKQNDEKSLFIQDVLANTNKNLRARIHVSDQKIYQSNIEGFDIFRLLNYKDLEETYGGITKLITMKDNLYSLQEKAITYLSVGTQVLEQADGETLSVKSSEVIGNMIIKDNLRGTQYLRSVVNAGDVIYFLDNRNKGIYMFNGDGASKISDAGIATKMREFLGGDIPERTIMGLYNADRGQLLMGRSDGSFCYSFVEPLKLWESNVQFPDLGFQGGVYTNQNLYIVGKDYVLDTTALSTYNTGEYTRLSGVLVTPSVTFVVNPDAILPKVFDNVLIDSTEPLSTMSMTVGRMSALADQVQTPDVDLLTIGTRSEGNFKVKVLRDAEGRRLRGLNSIITLNWDSSDSAIENRLSTVTTKYRTSENTV
jgi:hypothetical protein